MTHPFLWSVRRELWENRSIVVAPLVVALLALFGFVAGLDTIAGKMRDATLHDAPGRLLQAVMPYGLAASVVVFTSFLVGMLYCLDALFAERRDRSILFWKSMPVSDRTAVLAKAFVPFALQPAVGFAVALVTQIVMIGVAAIALAAHGMSASAAWSGLPFASMAAVMLYGIVVHSLWFAPIYGYLLLVSASVRRSPLVWAVLPLLAIVIAEGFAFGTSHFAALLKDRLVGAMPRAFTRDALQEPATQISQMDPAGFLATPGLWLGLAVAALFLFAAVRLRRYREPL